QGRHPCPQSAGFDTCRLRPKTIRARITMSNHRLNHAGLLERLIFNNRPLVILLCLLATLVLAWQASQIRPSTSFEKMIPLEHPYIQNMIEHRDDLANLGNTVRIAVAVKRSEEHTSEL